MNDYIIMTDSGCDISTEILTAWGVKCIDLTFRKAENQIALSNKDMPISDFYEEMRRGTVFQTSAANPTEYKDAFLAELRRNSDIVYIAFSSELSVSKYFAELAAQDAAEEFSSQRVTVVDSLCASAGQGLLVYLAVQKKKEGADFDTMIRYLSETAPKICHWFTVDDLKYLKRGGRIAAAAAFAATVLDIKPVMHMDEMGHLAAVSKVRGRRHAIKALAERYQLLAENPADGTWFISHSDCLDDAVMLENMITRKFGNKAAFITDIGPVIGSHSGPGTLALFFIGKQR